MTTAQPPAQPDARAAAVERAAARPGRGRRVRDRRHRRRRLRRARSSSPTSRRGSASRRSSSARCSRSCRSSSCCSPCAGSTGGSPSRAGRSGSRSSGARPCRSRSRSIIDLGVQLAIAFAQPGGGDRRGGAGRGAGAARRGDGEGHRGAADLRVLALALRRAGRRARLRRHRRRGVRLHREHPLLRRPRSRRAVPRSWARRSSCAASSRRSPTCSSRRASASRSASGRDAAAGPAWSAGSCSGLSGAVLLHALWNGSLAFAADAIGLYFTVQVPIFLGAVLLTVFLRRQEVRITRRPTRASTAPRAGSAPPRSRCSPRLRADVRRGPGRARRRRRAPAAMRKLITDATHLAFTRQRLVTGRGGGRAAAVDEQCAPARPSPPTGSSSCAEPARRDARARRARAVGATPRTRKLAALWCGNADISTGRRVLGFQSA